MKVTLIQPRFFNIWESLGFGYIAAYCKKNFEGELEFQYFNGYFDSDEEIISKSIDSDIVAFSCTSPTFKHGRSLASQIKMKNPNVQTVFGGYHASAINEVVELKEIDQIVVGEGEKAFLSILNGNRDKIVMGSPITFEELPFPDREIIKNEREINLSEEMCGERIASFQSKRVCPYKCAMCAEKIITGSFNRKTNPIRSRDAKDLLDEIEFVAEKYKLHKFKFVDATWNTSLEDVKDFCKEKIKRNFDLEWEAMIHAGLAKEEMFYWMEKANCKQINVGCESGSSKVLKEIGKGLTVEKIIKVFEWGRKYNISRRGFFLIGMPSETQEDIKLTEELVEKIEPDVFGVTIICPYPGSDLYDHKKFSEIQWDKTDEYSNDFWETEHFSNKELKNIQNYLVEKFENNLAWHSRLVLEGRKPEKN